MDRDSLMKDLRPILPQATFGEEVKAMERFQNQTLRPILKFQNDLLIGLFRDYLKSKKVQFDTLAPQQQLEKIKKVLQGDQRFRPILLGGIIGLMTAEELNIYLPQKSEFNKRIISMLIQRFQSQLSSLT